MSFKINIKHKVYEVICPVSGKHVFVRGLSIAEQNVLGSSVTSYSEGLKILLNVFFDAIQNKEVYSTGVKDEDLFENFLKQTYWDDLTAIAIGILNRINPEKDATLDLKIVCSNDQAKELNEEGICGKQYTAKFAYDNLISSIKVNEEQKDIYSEINEDEFPDYGVKITVETPNLYKELLLLTLIDKLNRGGAKAFKKHDISDYHKDAVIATIFSMNMITGIQELDNPDNKIKLDFNDLTIDSVLEFGKILIQFDSLNELTNSVNPEKFQLESISESKCPKCGFVQKIDLKEWIIDTFFPVINNG